MNQRIKEAATRAGLLVNGYPQAMTAEQSLVAYEEFAKCLLADVVDVLAAERERWRHPAQVAYSPWDRQRMDAKLHAVYDAIAAVRSHFEVEEQA